MAGRRRNIDTSSRLGEIFEQTYAMEWCAPAHDLPGPGPSPPRPGRSSRERTPSRQREELLEKLLLEFELELLDELLLELLDELLL